MADASDPRGIAASIPESPAAIARWLRRRLAAGGGDPADWRDYAAALAALGFHDRAANAMARAGPPLPPPAPPPPARPAERPPVRVFVSGYVPPPDEADREDLGRNLGSAHYSYGFAMRGFLAGLARIGVPHAVIRHPEFVPDVRGRSDAAVNLHLGFYPPDRLRLLKGACNVLCFAWEFDRLRRRAEVTDPHAFADQATMLNRVDALWVPSRHGAAAVARGVSVPVHAVPAPVFEDMATRPRRRRPTRARLGEIGATLAGVGWEPLAILPRLQADMDRDAARNRRGLPRIVEVLAADGTPTLFVTVLNPHDYRKQIRPMLQGFAEFARTHRDAVLLVKCSSPDAGRHAINNLLLHEQISAAGERARSIVSDRIWLTDDAMTREEMRALYDAGAFYLSTSHAEGQNLPLIEAMGRGAVPVSVDHTAMADYIRADNAMPIRSTRRPFDLRLTRRYGLYGLHTNHVAAADVLAALETAMALDEAGYAARSAAALATVRERFGPAPLLAAVRAATEAARARMGAAHG